MKFAAEISSINIATQCLEKHNIPYILGKNLDKQTEFTEKLLNLIKKRKEQGCLAVDMECTASLAIAKI